MIQTLGGVAEQKRFFSNSDRQRMKETFGQFISRHRKRIDLTQGELAAKAGISQSYVSGLEREINKEPDRRYVISLAKALDVPVGEALSIAGLSPEGAEELSRPDMVTEEIGRIDGNPIYIYYTKGSPESKIRKLREVGRIVLDDDPE